MTDPILPDSVRSTVQLVRVLFKGQNDLSGQPMSGHCERVASRLFNQKRTRPTWELQAALLHDTLEDTPMTAEELGLLGYADEVVEVVKILTHHKRDSYQEYVRRIALSGNQTAIQIKLCDLDDNSDPKRHTTLPPATSEALLERYQIARNILTVGV